MLRTLPPLKALLAYEAAARHKSFTLAADELGVTQGAVSKQIRILEDYFGVRLFERAGKQVTLTRQAMLYLPSLTDAFDGMAHATAQLGHAGAKTEPLTISILPSLSSRWLIPLLKEFHTLHPRYHVRVIIGDGPIDFNVSDADIALRTGRSKNAWKGLDAEPLMGEELLPVASPALLAKTAVKKPDDFLTFKLLQHTTRPGMWEEYLHSIGARTSPVQHAMGFEHFFMLIQGALGGLGIALIPRFLIAKELREGSLVIAYAKQFKSPYRYYLICPKRSRELKKIRAFKNWLTRKINALQLPEAQSQAARPCR